MRKATTAAAMIFCLGLSAAAARAETPRLETQDYLDIQQLYARFNHTLDTRRADDYAELWTSDGEFVPGRGPGRGKEDRTPIKGRAALHAMAKGPGNGGRHFVTNLILTPQAGMVKASSYLLLMDSRYSPPRIVETAIYDDTVVKENGQWKFKRRVNWRDDDDITPFKPPPPPGP